MTTLTFAHLHRLTEEELTHSMRGVSRLFAIYDGQRREAMAGVWGSILEALDLEWDRREQGESPHRVEVDFATLPRLSRDEIRMLLTAGRGVRDESSRVGRVGRAELYGRLVNALEAEWGGRLTATGLFRDPPRDPTGDSARDGGAQAA